jgi:hypothetical protein
MRILKVLSVAVPLLFQVSRDSSNSQRDNP